MDQVAIRVDRLGAARPCAGSSTPHACGTRKALEADHEFLAEGDVFTPDLIETWIDWKTQNEILPIQRRPHPHEFELYHDI